MGESGAYGRGYFTAESAKDLNDFRKYEDVARRLNIPLGADIVSLDVGCAEGAVFGSTLHSGRFFGVDVSEHAVRVCRERYPSAQDRIAVVDFNHDLPPFEGTFDLVTAFDVVEHLDNLEPFKRFLTTKLNPGGHLIITTPNAQSLMRLLGRPYNGDLDPTHVQLFTPYTLGFWLSRAGLSRAAVYTPWAFRASADGATARMGLGGQILAVFRK